MVQGGQKEAFLFFPLSSVLDVHEKVLDDVSLVDGDLLKVLGGNDLELLFVETDTQLEVLLVTFQCRDVEDRKVHNLFRLSIEDVGVCDDDGGVGGSRRGFDSDSDWDC